MASKLTSQQREDLRASHGLPVVVEDDEAQKVYYLVDADYLHSNPEHLKNLILEGINSNHVDADIVEKRLRHFADNLDARNA